MRQRVCWAGLFLRLNERDAKRHTQRHSAVQAACSQLARRMEQTYSGFPGHDRRDGLNTTRGKILMAEETKAGTVWQDYELDAIVADYFDMLEADLSGKTYVKSKHSAVLMARIGRTHRSVEFKHQNISAVLERLGMPWIPGYKPKRNYQNAIFDAIDRYLTDHPTVLQTTPVSLREVPSNREIFVAAPTPTASKERLPERLRRLVRKFDPVERDHRNRSLGRAGEAFVVDLERRQLSESSRPELANKVRWVAAEDGDGAGYDVLSYDMRAQPRLIEVKTTNGSARTPFFVTRNERELSEERPADWRIYRVHLFGTGPKIFTIKPPLHEAVKLAPETWRASF